MFEKLFSWISYNVEQAVYKGISNAVGNLSQQPAGFEDLEERLALPDLSSSTNGTKSRSKSKATNS